MIKQLRKLNLNARDPIGIQMEDQEAYKLGRSVKKEHDAAMILWEMSLRNPRAIRNVKIPGPFLTTSATC